MRSVSRSRSLAGPDDAPRRVIEISAVLPLSVSNFQIPKLRSKTTSRPSYEMLGQSTRPSVKFEMRRKSDRPSDLLSVDRKSTRLNSSHSQISYAVFCLKKKKK